MELTPNPKLQPMIDELLSLNLPNRTDVECIELVKPVVSAWVVSDDWILPEYYELRDGEKNHVIYLGEDGHLFVDVITWNQSEYSPIHDHNTWAVLGCVQGREKSQYWKRTDDKSIPGFAKIELLSTKAAGPGDVCGLTSEGIHCVKNCENATEPTISLHVYGFDLTKSGRSKYDPDNNTVEPMLSLTA